MREGLATLQDDGTRNSQVRLIISTNASERKNHDICSFMSVSVYSRKAQHISQSHATTLHAQSCVKLAQHSHTVQKQNCLCISTEGGWSPTQPRASAASHSTLPTSPSPLQGLSIPGPS